MDTPAVYMRVVRLCSPRNIQVVKSWRPNRWNTWLHETKTGCPFLVLRRGPNRFSVSRIRSSPFEKWRYLVRWPFPARSQKKAVLCGPDEVVSLILRESTRPTS